MDYYYNFDKNKTPDQGYYAPLGIGIELETGGHVFHLLFSNNKGLLESEYLTNLSGKLAGRSVPIWI